ncbi:MAG: hypothetical protein K2Q03_05685 [Sphingobacteriaceae bacterium]|nr:hypothetical protein [Sphingobacteriaceae bacterium]
MNLYNHSTLIYQLLLPHKRKDTWRLAMLKCLSYKIASLYEQLLQLNRDLKKEINITPQISVLQNYFCEKAGVSNRLLFFADGNKNGSIQVYISRSTATKQKEIEILLKKHLPISVSYTIVIF